MKIYKFIFILLFTTQAFAEVAKPTIRNITIEVSDIFDEADLQLPYRLVNQLKISTKTKVVQRELLFKEGDVYDEFVVKESARNLRSLPFFREVTITPHVRGQFVDIEVRVQDTWTLFPFFGVSTGGGVNRQTVGISEGNLLGYGKKLEFQVSEEESRQKIEGLYDDLRFLGTYQRLTLGHFQREDGDRSVLYYGRPFLSLKDRNSWQTSVDTFDLAGRLYDAGEERYVYRQDRQQFGASYIIARGDVEKSINRYGFGYDYLSDDFSQATAKDFKDLGVTQTPMNSDPNMLADDRTFSGPTFSYLQVEPDFISLNYIDRFERVEDFNLGSSSFAKLQIAPEVLDSTRNTIITQLNQSDGLRFSSTSFLRAEASAQARADSHELSNFILQGRLKYYNALGAKYLSSIYIGNHTLAASFDLVSAEKMDRDYELLLGAGTGLRGYEIRAFSGQHRAVLNLEDRFHITENIFKLFSVGGAVFFDAGGISNNGIGDAITDGLYSDIGIGLRIGLPRSAGTTVLRLDLALPLREGRDGSNAFEPRFLITAGQAFSAGIFSDVFSSRTGSPGFSPQ